MVECHFAKEKGNVSHGDGLRDSKPNNFRSLNANPGGDIGEAGHYGAIIGHVVAALFVEFGLIIPLSAVHVVGG